MVRSLSDPGHLLPLNAFPSVAHPSMSPQGNMVAVGNWRGDRTVVWDGQSGQVITELLPGQRTVAAAFSPDGSLLATGSSGEYRFWQTGTWTEVLKVNHVARTMPADRGQRLLDGGLQSFRWRLGASVHRVDRLAF